MKCLSIRMLPAVLLLGEAACTQGPRSGPETASTVQAVSNARQVTDVVGALESGDTRRARKLLKSMATRDPGDKRVRMLLESLNGDPVALLGTRAFSYRAQRGDDFATLSQRFLGNGLRFYLLVRYNGLKDAHLATGQLIRIPGVEPTPAPVVTRPKAEAVRADPNRSPRPTDQNPVPIANPRLAAILRARALAALNQGQITAAVVTLRQARVADPKNAAIQRDLARAERLLAAVKARK